MPGAARVLQGVLPLAPSIAPDSAEVYAARALDTEHERALRLKARERLSRGEIPRDPEGRLWAGPGVGLPCAVCDDPIGRHEIEYECQFPAGHALRIVRFHRLCHAIWELERIREHPET